MDPANDDLVVATGNAPFNGATDWGDSVVVLSPDASRMLRHWTPVDQQRLNTRDLDLGSTSPALFDGGYAVQGGKDGKLRLLQLHRLPGVNARTAASCDRSDARWRDAHQRAGDLEGEVGVRLVRRGTMAWLLSGGRLHAVWSNENGGTSPVIAGNLLYVAGSGSVHVYVPTSGTEVANLPVGDVHWQSPIVADGRVAMPEGNANDHATTGVLDIYRLP